MSLRPGSAHNWTGSSPLVRHWDCETALVFQTLHSFDTSDTWTRLESTKLVRSAHNPIDNTMECQTVKPFLSNGLRFQCFVWFYNNSDPCFQLIWHDFNSSSSSDLWHQLLRLVLPLLATTLSHPLIDCSVKPLFDCLLIHKFSFSGISNWEPALIWGTISQKLDFKLFLSLNLNFSSISLNVWIQVLFQLV